MIKDDKVHRFLHDVSGVELPTRFTYPFHYVPHELCKIAATEVINYALNQELWREELLAGKMLGVLVVKDTDGALGYLAAYSGNLAHNGNNPYFVPHIYNLLEPQGLFRTGEAEISKINEQINKLENSPVKKELEKLYFTTQFNQNLEVGAMISSHKDAKAHRDAIRAAGNISPENEQQLIKESQHQKAELRRLKKRHRLKLEQINQRMSDQEATINALKAKRRAMSEKLQRQLFELFVVRNARGESRDVATIFEQRLNRLPPGGTGECCAPKLLQYAFLHGYKPVCMAEFWVGESPQGEVRHHRHYYPACRSKCLPLLKFMLQGLDIDSNPLTKKPNSETLKIIFDDQWLIVVNKPAGMLTVPGKDEDATSALQIVQNMQPQGKTALEVHRIDQATSGLLVFAKTRLVQSSLRKQFEKRTVSKTYLALLDGVPPKNKGTIVLPLRPDIDDRPRQVVDIENGKEAITKYRVLERRDDRSLVEFTPLTGRTHQLRVHASHPQGLGCPITGDMLYGTASHRLCLHAYKLNFTHPITGEPLNFTSEISFL